MVRAEALAALVSTARSYWSTAAETHPLYSSTTDMRPASVGEYYLNKVLKPLTILVIGVPGRRIGARIIAEFRSAGAVSRSTAQRFRAGSGAEAAALRGLLEVEIIRQSEPGRFFLDEAALDAWLGWGWPQR
jgi:hypothetical protein